MSAGYDWSPDLATWSADGSHEGQPPLPRPWAHPDLSAVTPRTWDVCLRLAAVLQEGSE